MGRLPRWWWAVGDCAVALLVTRQVIELEPVVTLVLGLLLIPPALWFYVEKGAWLLWWVRHPGFPTSGDLAAAPNVRWHTPTTAEENSWTFEVRSQCAISNADVQSVEAAVTSSEANDVVQTFSFNDRGTHRVGEFTFRIRGTNRTMAQVTRRVNWRLIYFDTQGRFGYVTECWAEVAFDGNSFLLGPTVLDLSGPKARHSVYRKLPREQRGKYEAMFRGEG